MAANLQDLRNEQEQIRNQLLECYKVGDKSILALSKELEIPYTSFRGFMMGKSLGYKSLLKVKDSLRKFDSNGRE